MRTIPFFAAACIVAGFSSSVQAADDEKHAVLPVPAGQISSVLQGSATAESRIFDKSGFAAFNASQGGIWKANLEKNSGRVKLLYGGSSKIYSGGTEQAARSFLEETSAIFGLQRELSDLKTVRVDKMVDAEHVRLQQTYDGIPVRSAFVIVHSKKGQIGMVQNDYIADLAPANSMQISKEDALAYAKDDLLAKIDADVSIGSGKAEAVIELINDSYLFVWEVKIPTSAIGFINTATRGAAPAKPAAPPQIPLRLNRNMPASEKPFGLMVYHIDASNGTVLKQEDRIVSGLKTGRGRVYANNAAWRSKRLSTKPLPWLFDYPSLYKKGFLWGLHADIWDANGLDPYSSTLQFMYYPASNKPQFDATNAYYQVGSVIWSWWKKNLVEKYYGPNVPDNFYNLHVPIVTSVTGMCNAYYTSCWDESCTKPGMVFGDENACAAGSEDLVLDQGVVMHEYTHAMMDWWGFDGQFGGEFNGYGRSMGEGNADWFAYQLTKNPKMGDVAWAWAGPGGQGGYLRNLANTRVYPNDVDYPGFEEPEEHYTGEIWGGYLYDLSKVLGSAALKYIHTGMYYFSPWGGARDGYPDFQDGVWSQVLAEYFTTGKLTQTIKAWGSMASRGFNHWWLSNYSHSSNYFGTGAAGSDLNTGYMYMPIPNANGSSLKTKGKFLKSLICNEYPIYIAKAGQKLAVTVTGTNTYPDIYLFDASGNLLTSASGTASSASLTQLDLVYESLYSIITCGNGNESVGGTPY
ncbi:MAG TPA: M36 family metallopeptidase, partial [Methylomicrobium sp.]|nr:M36 family metallopeptidase [Methylomicrobium sp.]